MRPLGRREPTDWNHISKYRLVRAEAPFVVERSLSAGFGRAWRVWTDQGYEGACVGYSLTQALMSVERRRFHAKTLYDRAQQIDEFPETPPEEGTSVRAGCEVLRTEGPAPVRNGVALPQSMNWAISEYRWATDVDTLRATIRDGVPFVIGLNWYGSFDNPVRKSNGYWVTGASGGIRGGHALCFMDASDKRQAFRTLNTWGMYYPPTWFPYALIERLIGEQGEAAVLVP